MRKRLHIRRFGVSLVEALVALAIMSFGMLSLVGVQATMRMNSDLAKQRSEATRIATEEFERVRGFTSVGAVQGQPGASYDEIGSRTLDAYTPPGGVGNTTYRVERTVNGVAGTQQKVVMVRVIWQDRTGTRQTVTMDSIVSGTDPTLGALLTVPLRASALNQRGGRHVSIPAAAVDLGNGTSRFVPPGSSMVNWYFRNLTGEMYTCLNMDSTCQARLVSGTVQFDLGTVPNSEQPTGTDEGFTVGFEQLSSLQDQERLSPQSSDVRCFVDATDAIPGMNYYCSIPWSSKGWGGKLNLASLADDRRVCRYTNAQSDFTSNEDHPATYCMERAGIPQRTKSCTGRPVMSNLINQNFLVVRGSINCPADGSDPLINGNTRQHQPAL